MGIQTLVLATNFPQIYWNCACLIVNAGGTDLLEIDINDEENEKKKNKTSNYGKVAKAIGESKNKGIIVLPPDINKSELIFRPDASRNAILYGLKGLTRIGTDLVYTIFSNRPYSSIEDFMAKVKVNKTQMVSLIKAGTFDSLYNNSRISVMEHYLRLVADQKKRITLQNMQMLIEKQMIPETLDYERRLFNFNKYLKNFKDGLYYNLDTRGFNFYSASYPIDKLEEVNINDNTKTAKIKQSIWDSIYKKGMDPVRDWMKTNQQEILADLNNCLYQEIYNKYAYGNISQWEMESLNFYYHEHELENLNNKAYGIVDFFKLSEEPEVDRKFITKDGSEIIMYQINRIAGTIIDKDKNKSTITLLTTSGVVTVKIWKNQFAKWDKQISVKGADGKKHILERSFISKGSLLILTGIRRGDNFILKKYKSTEWPILEKINKLENGMIIDSSTERLNIDDFFEEE